MQEQQLLISSFVLHDPFFLESKSREPFFSDLRESNLIKQKLTSQQQFLKQLYSNLADATDSKDFSIDGCGMLQQCKFNWKNPFYIDTEYIQQYFGEKISIYFIFLSLLSKSQLWIGIIGLIAQIVIYSSENTSLQRTVSAVFSFINIIWCFYFMKTLQRKFTQFELQNGSYGITKNQNVNRSEFEGIYIRSFQNDNMNMEFYSRSTRTIKILIFTLISFGIIVSMVFTTLQLFTYQKEILNFASNILPISLASVVFSILLVLNQSFFDGVYIKLLPIFTDLENHQYDEDYQNQFIFKKFFFSFVSNFNPFFLIAFFSHYFPNANICRLPKSSTNDCFETLNLKVTQIFLINIVQNIPELVTPLLKSYYQQKKILKKQNFHNSPFYKIDLYIEEQSLLAPYNEDELQMDYLEIILQYSYLVLFSSSFPLAYFLACLNNILEIRIDFIKMVNCQRQSPVWQKNMGINYKILQIINIIGIFVNAGIIASTTQLIDQFLQFQVYQYILIAFFLILLLIQYIKEDISQQTIHFLNRQNFLLIRRLNPQSLKNKFIPYYSKTIISDN